MQDRYLNETEVSELCGLNVEWLRRERWKKSGPPFIKVAPGKRGKVLYSENDIRGWLESRKVQTTN